MICIFQDPESLSLGAAERFAEAARAAVTRRGGFSAALSGGRTPQHTYELLARSPWRERIDWSCVHLFWGDERCVPPDDPRNNAHMARRTLLDHVPVVSGQVHPIRGHDDPAAAAAAYESLLRNRPAPALDLVLLGLGRDGHTASLFPHWNLPDANAAWVVPFYSPEEGIHRITLTPPVINAARMVIFLVFGQEKAEALEMVLEGPNDPQRWPAQRINPEKGRLVWLVDRAAASRLGRATVESRQEAHDGTE